MRRLLRRGAPVLLAVAMVMALQGEAVAAPIAVSITNFQFTPASAAGPLNTVVTWTNNGGATHHTTTSDTSNPDGSVGIALWDSGSLAGGATFPFTFTAAGSYTYHCTIHPTMMATIKIRPLATPGSGPPGTRFTIQVSTSAAAAGFVFDVQKKNPGGTFKNWKVGKTAKAFAFTPPVAGTFQFRARLRRTATSGVTGFSPAVAIMVTP
jgi:plastocyanin